jgi:transposase
MKLIRSSKCSLKFATQSKLDELKTILTEYGKVCNVFIEHFWKNGTPSKSDLLKDIVDLPKDTWLSARLRKVAAREAIDMIIATKERWKNKPDKMKIPVHKGKRMYVSCTIADLVESKETTEFDAWLHIASVGEKHILDLPIKFHKHYNKIAMMGKRLNSYIITDRYVQFSFEINTQTKKEPVKCFGIDTGINALASLNDGEQFGTEIKSMIERIKRCCHGSNGQKKARRAIKQYIDECVKQIMALKPDLIVVERLKKMGFNSKLKARLSKSIRASIGAWNWKYWLKRLEQACEINRVSFRTVLPMNTSITCPKCGCIDKGNRLGTVFKCRSCDHTGDADVIAALNILNRFLTGIYGSCCKPEEIMNFNIS